MLQLKNRDLILEELNQLDESVLLGLWSDLSSKKKVSKKPNKKISKNQKFKVKPFSKENQKEIEIKANFSYFNDSNSSNRFTKSGVRYSRHRSLKNQTDRA